MEPRSRLYVDVSGIIWKSAELLFVQQGPVAPAQMDSASWHQMKSSRTTAFRHTRNGRSASAKTARGPAHPRLRTASGPQDSHTREHRPVPQEDHGGNILVTVRHSRRGYRHASWSLRSGTGGEILQSHARARARKARWAGRSPSPALLRGPRQ